MAVVDQQIEMFKETIAQDSADARIGGAQVSDIAKDGQGLCDSAITDLNQRDMSEATP